VLHLHSQLSTMLICLATPPHPRTHPIVSVGNGPDAILFRVSAKLECGNVRQVKPCAFTC
jgi:hypothetical protein